MSSDVGWGRRFQPHYQYLPTEMRTRSLAEDIRVQEFVAEFALWVELLG
jgi:hypothetical protein